MHERRANSVDGYLEAIYALVTPIGGAAAVAGASTTASQVAAGLGVSRAAAGEMLKRLEVDGLVERGERRELRLTGAGTERAERAVRRGRIAERFLADFLGYDPTERADAARRLGDAMSDAMAERMHDRLGSPERCPHGWPIEIAEEQAENPELVALDEVESGESVSVVRLSERDGELLSWFYREGIVPGARVDVVALQRAAGQLHIRLNGESRSVTEKAAGGVLVRRDRPHP